PFNNWFWFPGSAGSAWERELKFALCSAKLIPCRESLNPDSESGMICISIAQESRRLALADMLNAARQCDLLEIRLDRFDKAPDVGELLAHKPKPVILSCRR